MYVIDFIQKIMGYLCFPVPNNINESNDNDKTIDDSSEVEKCDVIECNGKTVEIFPNFLG